MSLASSTVPSPPLSMTPGRRATAVLLITAPLLELVETVLSPLRDGTTRSELGRIADHQALFATSVLFGLAAVVLYLPTFLGLADACLGGARRTARVAGWTAALSMLGFAGVRGIQAVQLQTARDGLDRDTAATLLDHTAANPIGAPLVVLFLAGSVIGVITLGVATWRTGFPRPAVVLLVLFPVVDLGIQSHLGTIASHALLLAALWWLAVSLLRGGSGHALVGDHAPAVPVTVGDSDQHSAAVGRRG